MNDHSELSKIGIQITTDEEPTPTPSECRSSIPRAEVEKWFKAMAVKASRPLDAKLLPEIIWGAVNLGFTKEEIEKWIK